MSLLTISGPGAVAHAVSPGGHPRTKNWAVNFTSVSGEEFILAATRYSMEPQNYVNGDMYHVNATIAAFSPRADIYANLHSNALNPEDYDAVGDVKQTYPIGQDPEQAPMIHVGLGTVIEGDHAGHDEEGFDIVVDGIYTKLNNTGKFFFCCTYVGSNRYGNTNMKKPSLRIGARVAVDGRLYSALRNIRPTEDIPFPYVLQIEEVRFLQDTPPLGAHDAGAPTTPRNERIANSFKKNKKTPARRPPNPPAATKSPSPVNRPAPVFSPGSPFALTVSGPKPPGTQMSVSDAATSSPPTAFMVAPSPGFTPPLPSAFTPAAPASYMPLPPSTFSPPAVAQFAPAAADAFAVFTPPVSPFAPAPPAALTPAALAFTPSPQPPPSARFTPATAAPIVAFSPAPGPFASAPAAAFTPAADAFAAASQLPLTSAPPAPFTPAAVARLTTAPPPVRLPATQSVASAATLSTPASSDLTLAPAPQLDNGDDVSESDDLYGSPEPPATRARVKRGRKEPAVAPAAKRLKDFL